MRVQVHAILQKLEVRDRTQVAFTAIPKKLIDQQPYLVPIAQTNPRMMRFHTLPESLYLSRGIEQIYTKWYS